MSSGSSGIKAMTNELEALLTRSFEMFDLDGDGKEDLCRVS